MKGRKEGRGRRGQEEIGFPKQNKLFPQLASIPCPKNVGVAVIDAKYAKY